MKTLLSRAVAGAVAGAMLGALEQLLTNFPPDLTFAALLELLPRLSGGAAIGALLWALFAVALGSVTGWSDRAPTRSASLIRWCLGVPALALGAMLGLWLAGRFGRGFSQDFALFHSLGFVAPAAIGVWLGGATRRSVRTGR